MTLNQALISSTILNASAASVTIAVPSGYTDVRFVISARDASTAQYANDLQININGSSANVSNTILYGNGAGVGTGNTTVWLSGVPGNSSTANTFSNVEVYISDYANASKPKAFTADGVTENNATNSMIILGSGLYNSNTPITSVTFNLYGGTSFTAGSSFTLYGISKLGVTPTATPKASGGEIVVNDGTYWYHTFLSTGLFSPQQTLSCEALIVSGGGGGSNSGGIGSGGGGGSVYYNSAISASAGDIAVIVGAGGAASGSSTGNGGDGSASIFNAISSVVVNGGVGGGSGTFPGGNSKKVISGTTTNYTGGTGAGDPNNATRSGGGGAGAGTNGGNASLSLAGLGGAGLNTYSSWATATGTGASGYYAGGGGGGFEVSGSYTQASGGSGGGGKGGAGTVTYNADHGVTNTGGGGGGCGGRAGVIGGASGNGGSGIVIIRYAMA